MNSASYSVILLEIDGKKLLTTKLYDKRDDFRYARAYKNRIFVACKTSYILAYGTGFYCYKVEIFTVKSCYRHHHELAMVYLLATKETINSPCYNFRFLFGQHRTYHLMYL